MDQDRLNRGWSCWDLCPECCQLSQRCLIWTAVNVMSCSVGCIMVSLCVDLEQVEHMSSTSLLFPLPSPQDLQGQGCIGSKSLTRRKAMSFKVEHRFWQWFTSCRTVWKPFGESSTSTYYIRVTAAIWAIDDETEQIIDTFFFFF